MLQTQPYVIRYDRMKDWVRLPGFLLVPVFSEPLLALVSSDLMSFSLFTAGHYPTL